MGKIGFVELCDFDTSTDKEVKEGHLRPAFVIDAWVRWWGFCAMRLLL